MSSAAEPLEVSDSDETSSSYIDESWVAWYCSMPGHELYCEVEKMFIEDNFNLFGIRFYIRNEEYNPAMNTILDKGGISFVLHNINLFNILS